MRTFLRVSLASTSLLALAACGPGRLSDQDVTRLCMLTVRCSGVVTQAACEASVTAQRDAANASGCGGQFGAVARCAIRADECTALPEDCVDEQMRLTTCQSRRDTGSGGGTDAGRIEGIDTGPIVFPDTGLECTPAAEEFGVTYCTDGCDNDDNGVFDCNEEACCGSVECPAGTVCGAGTCPPGEEIGTSYCTDGCDNDGDDVYDCNDSDCCATLLGTCGATTLCGTPGDPSELRNSSGFLEIYYMGEWRPICDDGFDMLDADVACRHLGYSGADSFMTSVAGTNDSFWLDDLACTGTEERLDLCPHSGWGSENCSRTESVQVVCY